ncbi:putative tail assembly protein [Caudoviricetes sp.]|nr:putative tail assembly protein [Caudoviricetes sp.]
MSGEGTVKVSMPNLGALRNRLQKMTTQRRNAVRKAIKISAYELQGDIRKSILRDPHTGRIYGKHQASAPGETPASDTGNLARNIIVLSEKDGDAVYIVSRAPYSAALEFGSYHNRGGSAWRVEPRPFMLPAMVRNHAKIVERIKKAISGEA